MKHSIQYCNCINAISVFFFLKKKIKFALLSIFLVIVSLQSNAQDPIVTDSFAIIHDIGEPGMVIKNINFTLLHFHKEAGNRINFGIAEDAFKYFIIKVQASDGIAEKELSIDNTSLDTIGIYRIYPGVKSTLLYLGGSLIPYKSSKHFVWHTIPLSISVEPSYYLIAAKAAQKNINVSYEIVSREELQQKYQAHDRVVFFYTGMICLIIFIIFLAWYLFRKPVFLIYLGYIISISVWIVSHYGYVFPLVYPHIPVLNEIIKPLSSLGAGYFLIVLLSAVFQQHLQLQPWLQKMLKAMQYALPLVAASMLVLLFHNLLPLIKTALMALWHIGLLFSVCLIVFTPVYFIHSGSTAKIFSTAMLVVCLVVLVQLFSNSGYINNYFINEHIVTMGSLLENFIVAFGLFYSLLEENNEKKKQVILLEQDKNEALKKLVTLQDDERKRIANDLHDNIGPLLAAIKINFRRLVNNKDALQNGLAHKTEMIIDDSILEIRNVAHNLMPKGLTSKGLIHAIEEYFEDIQPVYNKKIIFNHDVQSIPSPDIQANIYRIICELVLNAVKHSDAEELTVCITSNNKTISISIKDDGKGFNLKSADFKNSFGLQSAESRIHYMNGKFILKTAPGRGTFIDMEIPLQANQS